MPEDKQPWWNDQDKAGGAMATVAMFCGIVLVFVFCLLGIFRLFGVI